MIGELALAMRAGMFTGRLAQTTHAYPTWSLGIQQAAAQFFSGYGDRPAGAGRGAAAVTTIPPTMVHNLEHGARLFGGREGTGWTAWQTNGLTGCTAVQMNWMTLLQNVIVGGRGVLAVARRMLA
jgi:hypothetical protein